MTTEIQLDRHSQSAPATEYVLATLRGQKASEVYSKKELGQLWWHLHNDNGPFDWVMGFRDKETGRKHYARSKKVPVGRGISWAIATAEGSKTPEKSLAYVPYSTNPQQMSRWGGFDFDAHGGETERARRLAFGAFRLLLNCESATILESSGSGGWHVWAISKELKPVSYWIRLLKLVARDIGAPVESGVCEIFPPDTLSRGFGKGMRAPGAWNPATNTVSEIWWQNAEELIAELPPRESRKSSRIGEVHSHYSVGSPIEKKISLSLPPLTLVAGLIGDVADFEITKATTRHERLQKFVGAAFHQLSRNIAERAARAQFAGKMVPTNADEAEHMEDFTSLWTGLELLWLESLSGTERELLDHLSTDAERDAFRIIRSYGRKAAKDGALDFPVARDNLGDRLGITGRGAGMLRKKIEALGIIELTKPYIPNVAAARFRWTANCEQPF